VSALVSVVSAVSELVSALVSAEVVEVAAAVVDAATVVADPATFLLPTPHPATTKSPMTRNAEASPRARRDAEDRPPPDAS
jgi:hypothetical protein